MNNLLQAIQACDNGNVIFNQTSVRSFLFNKNWYPLRAALNHAAGLGQEPNDMTTDQCLVALVNLGIWTRIEEINYGANHPLPIDQNTKTQELTQLINILHNLTK